jgi:hypothetical protein
MLGLARAYGSDNGKDSDAGPDGNGDADIPSYGTEFESANCKLKRNRNMKKGALPLIHWMRIN